MAPFPMIEHSLICINQPATHYHGRAHGGCQEQMYCLQTKYIGWHIAAVIKLITKCCFKIANIWNPHILHAIIWFSKCLDSRWKFALTRALKCTLGEHTMHFQQQGFFFFFHAGETQIWCPKAKPSEPNPPCFVSHNLCFLQQKEYNNFPLVIASWERAWTHFIWSSL